MFPMPTQATLSMAKAGRLYEAAGIFCERATATLGGEVVYLRRVSAARYLKGLIKTGTPPVMSRCHCESAGQRSTRLAAEALKLERYAVFLEQDGHKGLTLADGECCSCAATGPVTVHWSPDAMGYPTEVMKTCDACDPVSAASRVRLSR